jgi:hypothetical protein
MVYRDYDQHYRDIVQSNATAVVTRPAELIAAAKEELQNPAHKAKLRATAARTMTTNTDGTASQKTIELIRDILQHAL